jgi:uncharacterized membrane protein YhaH (DUF805 family)
MGFAAAVRDGVARYATFSGRSGRPAYWWFWLACLGANLAAAALDLALFGSGEVATVETATPGGGDLSAMVAVAETGGPISLVVALATLVPLLAAGWRRMQDVGKSGWLSVLHYAIFLAGFPLALIGGGLILEVVALAALVAAVWVLVQLLRRGDPAPNRFGPAPGA